MGKIRSWDDFEPEERDYFDNRHKKPREETDIGNTQDVRRSLEEAMKELEGNIFAEVLTIVIEKEIFQ